MGSLPDVVALLAGRERLVQVLANFAQRVRRRLAFLSLTTPLKSVNLASAAIAGPARGKLVRLRQRRSTHLATLHHAGPGD